MKTLPNHLNRYVVNQNYDRYTSEDQAVWRFIMRQLKSFLIVNGHKSYGEGLVKTGINTESIPRISQMDQKLQEFGWRAVPVSGFIPPAAFMEFQSLGFLPIACDMRTIDHILYTPAPDIVHEAAGHAPILIHPDFSDYLQKYASVARYSILSKEDLEQYAAIRDLSDIKENPSSSAQDIAQAEQRLAKVNGQIRFVSEAGYLARMNWWTAEYGLIGSLEHPKIFGAGLLSSIGESRHYMNPQVTKLPLSIDCLNYSYDITEPQPQLFVAHDFRQLHSVLEQLAEKMSFRRGGVAGLDEAIKAQTVNSVVLNSGLEIAGQLVQRRLYQDKPSYLQFQGPTQLAFDHTELAGHGISTHPHGFGTPVGFLKGQSRCLSEMEPKDLQKLGIVRGQKARLEFASGVVVEGTCQNILTMAGNNLLLSLVPCTVTLGEEILFDPSWGSFDMAVGSQVVSVFGGPADRQRYELKEDFVSSRVPEKSLSSEKRVCNQLYSEIRRLREQDRQIAGLEQKIVNLMDRYFADAPNQWLLGVEFLEWAYTLQHLSNSVERLREHLQSKVFSESSVAFCIDQGIKLASNGL